MHRDWLEVKVVVLSELRYETDTLTQLQQLDETFPDYVEENLEVRFYDATISILSEMSQETTSARYLSTMNHPI